MAKKKLFKMSKVPMLLRYFFYLLSCHTAGSESTFFQIYMDTPQGLSGVVKKADFFFFLQTEKIIKFTQKMFELKWVKGPFCYLQVHKYEIK